MTGKFERCGKTATLSDDYAISQIIKCRRRKGHEGNCHATVAWQGTW